MHDHATTSSNDLYPPKPKRNVGKITFNYAGTISLPNCVKSATSVSSFKDMMIKYFIF